MKAPTPAQRRRARIDTPWQAGRYVTEAGNALDAKHTPEFKHAARATAELLRRHIGYARNPDAAPSYVKPAPQGRTVKIDNVRLSYPAVNTQLETYRELARRMGKDADIIADALLRHKGALFPPPLTAEEIARLKRQVLGKMRRQRDSDPDQ